MTNDLFSFNNFKYTYPEYAWDDKKKTIKMKITNKYYRS